MWLNESNVMLYSRQKPFTKFIDSEKAFGRSVAIIVKNVSFKFYQLRKVMSAILILLHRRQLD